MTVFGPWCWKLWAGWLVRVIIPQLPDKWMITRQWPYFSLNSFFLNFLIQRNGFAVWLSMGLVAAFLWSPSRCQSPRGQLRFGSYWGDYRRYCLVKLSELHPSVQFSRPSTNRDPFSISAGAPGGARNQLFLVVSRWHLRSRPMPTHWNMGRGQISIDSIDIIWYPWNLWSLWSIIDNIWDKQSSSTLW